MLHLCLRQLDTELDEDSDEGVTQHEQNPGVDDGFFSGNRPELGGGGGGGDGGGGGGTDDYPTFNHIPNDIPSYPYAPGFNPNVVGEELEQLYVVQNKTFFCLDHQLANMTHKIYYDLFSIQKK